MAKAGMKDKQGSLATFRFKDTLPSSGSSSAAQEERALLRCAQEVVRCMHLDRSSVMPLYNLAMERKDDLHKSGTTDQDSFSKKVSTLRSLDADWVLEYLQKKPKFRWTTWSEQSASTTTP